MSATMGIKKLLSLSLVGMAMAISSQASAGTIKGSVHDFSTTTWTTQICLACHTPHNGKAGQGAPLWGHDTSAGPFTPYTGIVNVATNKTNMNATPVSPTGTSLLCLSCHDGTVALDSFGAKSGGLGTTFLTTGRANLTTDLTNDHPISFIYDPALATADGSLFDPTVALSNKLGKTGPGNGGGTISADLLEGGDRMECSSCHDVHNTFTGAAPATGSNYLLKVDNTKSGLCLTCHNK